MALHAVLRAEDLDRCSVDWSPMITASHLSSLAAVLAGFVFLGITGLLSNTVPGARIADTGRALRLLITAFFGFIVSSYMFSSEAGEQVCSRAQSEEVALGGVLATSVLVMLAALTWLLVAFDRRGTRVIDYLLRLIYFAAVLITLLLWISSTVYMTSVRPGHSHAAAKVTFAVIAISLGVALPCWLLKRHLMAPIQPADGKLDSRVKSFTRLAIANVALTAFAIGAALHPEPEFWEPSPPAWLVLAFAGGGLILPLLVVASCVPALAPADGTSTRPPASETAEQPAETDHPTPPPDADAPPE